MEKLLIQKLALERCRNDLTHLCALMHLTVTKDTGDGATGGGAMQHLIASMNEELKLIECGLDALAETYSGQ